MKPTLHRFFKNNEDMQRDNLDFKNMSVSRLFTKQLFPTLLGMVSSALFTVVDGIFVGRGIGSDAIAAVNIAAPIFMIAAGLGLMFGMGGGILLPLICLVANWWSPISMLRSQSLC